MHQDWKKGRREFKGDGLCCGLVRSHERPKRTNWPCLMSPLSREWLAMGLLLGKEVTMWLQHQLHHNVDPSESLE